MGYSSGQLTVHLKANVRTEYGETGTIHFKSEYGSYSVSTTNFELARWISNFTILGFDYSLIHSFETREALLFRIFEKEMASLGFLEYTFSSELGIFGSIYPRPAKRKQHGVDIGLYSELCLSEGVSLLNSNDGTFELINTVKKCKMTLSPLGLISLCEILSFNNSVGFKKVHGFAEFLFEQNFLKQQGAITDLSKKMWPPHEMAFHFLSRNPHTGYVTSRTPAHLPSNWTSSTLLDRKRVVNQEILNALKNRRSRRCEASVPIWVEDIQDFFYFLLEEKVESNGTIRRNFPAAGGFYKLEFFVAINRCIGIESGIYNVCKGFHNDKPSFTKLDKSLWALEHTLNEAAAAWGMPDIKPDVLVFIAIDNTEASKKYGGRAYRLALLNGGVLLQVMYMLADALGLAGCAIGSSSETLECIVNPLFPDYFVLIEFALEGLSN